MELQGPTCSTHASLLTRVLTQAHVRATARGRCMAWDEAAQEQLSWTAQSACTCADVRNGWKRWKCEMALQCVVWRLRCESETTPTAELLTIARWAPHVHAMQSSGLVEGSEAMSLQQPTISPSTWWPCKQNAVCFWPGFRDCARWGQCSDADKLSF